VHSYRVGWSWLYVGSHWASCRAVKARRCASAVQYCRRSCCRPSLLTSPPRHPPPGPLRPSTIISRAHSACADPVTPPLRPLWFLARRDRTHQHTRALSAVVLGFCCEELVLRQRFYVSSCLQALRPVANYDVLNNELFCSGITNIKIGHYAQS